MKGESKPPAYLDAALDQLFGQSPRSVELAKSVQPTFIDLFAGIGGIRLGLESAGAKCVFTSEWDKYAVRTYEANHESDHEVMGDITQLPISDIPAHDVLAAGFPCQPFSLAGVSKKNSLGRKHGFLDETQGTLFFDVAKIIAARSPRAVLLENVKNLLSHDQGRTFKVIEQTLTRDLGYTLHYKVLDAQMYLPQHRQRVILLAFRDGEDFDWSKVKPAARPLKLDQVLHPQDGSEVNSPFVDENGLVLAKYTLSDRLWIYLQEYAKKHKEAGNGFGYGLVTKDSVTRTLSARYYKDGSEILVDQGEGKNPRRLTPRECARLMGFDDTFKIPVSDTQAYKQFGNSVAVPVISAVAQELVRQLS